MIDKLILEKIKKQLEQDKILEPYYYFTTPKEEEKKNKIKVKDRDEKK